MHKIQSTTNTAAQEYFTKNQKNHDFNTNSTTPRVTPHYQVVKQMSLISSTLNISSSFDISLQSLLIQAALCRYLTFWKNISRAKRRGSWLYSISISYPLPPSSSSTYPTWSVKSQRVKRQVPIRIDTTFYVLYIAALGTILNLYKQ